MKITETPNFHRFTVNPANAFTDFKTIHINDGMIIIGRLNGRLEIQSMLFSKSTHDLNAVRIRAFYYQNMFKNV